MADSFSVTLVSNQSGEQFANNTSSSFSNALPRTMDLSKYELALQSIHLTDHFPQIVAVGEPNVPKNFFNEAERDNEITVITSNAAQMRPRKETDDFAAFIDKLNVDLAFVKIPVIFTKTVVGGNVTQLSFSHIPKLGYTLEIDETLRRILGYSQSEFGAGTFQNDKPPDFAYFNSLANGYVGLVTSFEEARTHVLVSQLAEKPDIEVLFGFIKKALDDHFHKTRFIVDTKRGTVSYTVESVAKRILFSSFLNKYLGLPNAFSFNKKGSIKLARDILFPSKIKPPPVSCSKLLVMCDIIQPQIFAGKEKPLLAVMERNHTTEATEITFEPRSLVYKPTQVGNVNHIAISIQTDNNENIPHQNSPTVVNLHFRKMRDIKCDEMGTCKLVKLGNQPKFASDFPDDLILMKRSRSPSPDTSTFEVKRKPIKAAPSKKGLSSKKKPVGRGRPKQQPSKPAKKPVKRGRPPKVTKPKRGRPPTKKTKQSR